jgi:uncharacterized protein YjbI with pentapeptide repeats
LWIAAGVVAALLAVFLSWVLFVPVADWIAQHDVGHATGSSLETARNNARGNVLALAAGIAGFGALLYTARNFALQRRTLALAQEGQRRAEESQRRTLELAEQGQVTDRYTKAIEQLGSEKLDIRIGGIYALERVARDSERDYSTIMEVLTTFIREHSPIEEASANASVEQQSVHADIQAALSVIRRREPRGKDGEIRFPKTYLVRANLTGAHLTGSDLARADLRNADLEGADLTGALLIGARLNGADLTGARLNGANLDGADLTGAKLCFANLTGARLRTAKLAGADLTRATLVNAFMPGANLTGAFLTSADLTDSTLMGADLSNTHLVSANLTNARLVRASLTRAELNSATLTGATFESADLTLAHLNPVDIPSAGLPRGWRQRSDGRIEATPDGGDS